MSSSLRNSPANRLSNWLYYGVFYSSVLQLGLSRNSVRKSPSPSPVTVIDPILKATADYPAGCQGGPGPGTGKGTIQTSPGSCVHIKRGAFAADVQQNWSIGVQLDFEGLGLYKGWGALQIQLNLVDYGHDNVYVVENVYITGDVTINIPVLGMVEGISVRLRQENDYQYYFRNVSGESTIRMEACMGVLLTEWPPSTTGTLDFIVAGNASTEYLQLQGYKLTGEQYFSVLPFISIQRHGKGWVYKFILQVEGLGGPYASFSLRHVVVDGVLYD
ncbi:hypothetical protein FOZ61_002101 [Perkinsus olseni]|uniref:Uncharacterized protein n=1 Tax=Perkinsus olseni TaxID=32597 RepID=A0A7J6LUF4_PEROL|nr:hypothetical protein FOZ61_002101 [Perkinsus olseni]KAF4666053.1 hypothetical protein FOL46_003302 [Perkinsus olseni]